MVSLQEMYDQISAVSAEVIPAVAEKMGESTIAAPEDAALAETTPLPGQVPAPPAPAAEAEEENLGQTYADRRLQAATSALRNSRNPRKQII